MSSDAAPVLEPTKVILLDKPISAGGQTWDKLELSEPTAGQLEEVEKKAGLDWTISLVAANAGVPRQAVRQLPIRVLNEAGEYLVPFTSAVRPTPTDG